MNSLEIGGNRGVGSRDVDQETSVTFQGLKIYHRLIVHQRIFDPGNHVFSFILLFLGN